MTEAEHLANALLEAALTVRDLKASMRRAMRALDSGNHFFARKELELAIGDVSKRERKRDWID